MGLGTLINAVGVIIGGVVGILIGSKMPKRIQDSVLKSAGFAVLFLGIIGACQHALQISGDKLETKGTMMLVISLTFGTLIGEILNIEKLFESLGIYLKRVTKSEGDSSFVDAFITASLTICIGAMAILGSIQDGLTGDYTTLAAKATLDLFVIMILTVTNGKGSIFSVVPLVLFQGSITVLAKFIEPIMTPQALTNLSLVGSILIFCVGVNLVWNKNIRVANMLPAIVIAVIWAFV